jgi:hypothetical protein
MTYHQAQIEAAADVRRTKAKIAKQLSLCDSKINPPAFKGLPKKIQQEKDEEVWEGMQLKPTRRIRYRMQYRSQMPKNTIYVGRPTCYGNPYKVRQYGRNRVIELYRKWIQEKVAAGTINIRRLKGKNLACWCELDQECHADILLELARKA